MEEMEANDWQIPEELLPEALWDVLIIGAGPAGGIAATHLATHGYRVLLLDKEVFPRDKACGDGLITDALQSLQRIGLEEKVRQAGHAMGLVSVFSSSQFEFEIPGDYLTLRRTVLDEMIARRAIEAGATFAQGHVANLTFSGGLVTCALAGARRLCHARIAVIATGSRLDLPQKLGMVAPPKPSGFAMRCYVRSTLHLNHLIISFDRAITPGYAWIFPLGGNEYNIGCGVIYSGDAPEGAQFQEKFSHFLKEFPLARNLLRKGEIISPLRGAILRCGMKGASPLHGENILCIGETLGTTYPFTGEGTGKAMETGELAAEVIHNALAASDLTLLRQYPILLAQKLQPRYPGYQVAQRWFSHTWLNDFIAHRVQHSQFLQDAFTGLMTETVNPRTIFSWQGLMRSFLQ